MMTREAKLKQKTERARRRAICASCPALGKGPIKTCTRCGCLVVFVTISGPCPLHKW